MSELTPEERRKIYEEERKKIEAEPDSASVTPTSSSRSVLLWSVCALALVTGAGILIYRQNHVSAVYTQHEADRVFDPCEVLRETDPHCGWKPHWTDSGISVNAIDGKRTEFLSLESSDPDGMDYGQLHYAELRLCFEEGKLCGGSHIGAGVTVHGMVASFGDWEYSTSVRLKFDDGQALHQIWGISDDHEALFPHGHERQFVADLKQHNKLVLEFSYYESAARTVTFDLAGLADKMREENLQN